MTEKTGLTDTQIRTTDIMVNKNIKLRPKMIDWFRAEAVRNQTTVSHEIRRWLELAYKYRKSIQDAENAPARFVREVSR